MGCAAVTLIRIMSMNNFNSWSQSTLLPDDFGFWLFGNGRQLLPRVETRPGTGETDREREPPQGERAFRLDSCIICSLWGGTPVLPTRNGRER